MSRTAVELLPRWTSYVVTKLGGRDPLGLSRLSQYLTDHVLTGLVINTDRARYYSLYCWILWHCDQCHPDAAWAVFQQAYQRREAAVAYASLLADESASVVGSRAVLAHLQRDGEDLDTQFKVLPANDLGGFGQYYGGSLHALGLTMRRESGADVLNPARPISGALACAVQASLVATDYLARRRFDAARVPRGELAAAGARLSVDGIREEFARDERRLLVDLFFGFDQPDPDSSTVLRRRSLTRLLHTVQAYSRAGVVIGERDLAQTLLYAPLYFGVLAADPPVPYAVPDCVRDVAAIWRQFCLHQYVTLACEGVLAAVLQALEAHEGAATMETVLDTLLTSAFSVRAEGAVGAPCGSPADLMQAVAARAAQMSYASSLNERVAHEKVQRPAELAARSVVLLAVLYARWRKTTESAYSLVAQRAGSDLSAPGVLPLLDTWCNAAATWRDQLGAFIGLLVQQHDRVMFEKGRLESRWLHLEENRLVHDQALEPEMRASRHRQATSIMADLGLLEWIPLADEQRSLVLTDAGADVLARALEAEA